MAHTFSGKAFYNSAASPANANWTVPSGATVLVVGIVTKRGGGTSARAGGAPTYNSAPLTQSGPLRSSSETDSEQWYLLAPPTGSSLQVSVPNTGTEQLHVKLSAFESATGTSALDVEDGATGSSTADATQSVTTTVDGAAIVDISGTGHKNAPTHNQTDLSSADEGQYSSNNQYALQSTFGSITFTHSQSGVSNWNIQVTAFKEVSADHTVAPGAGALTLEGFAPTLVQTDDKFALPAAAALTLTGFAPLLAVAADKTVLPGAGALTLTGFAPVLVQTDNKTVLPAQADLALTGFAPVLTLTLDLLVEPAQADLTLTGFAPTLVETDNKVNAPGAGALALTGFAPTLVQSLNITAQPASAEMFLGSIADYYSESNVSSFYGFGNPSFWDEKVAQSFTGDGSKLGLARAYIRSVGAPTGNITAILYAHSGTFGVNGIPTGAALATSTVVDSSTISTTESLVEFVFDGSFTLESATNYFISFEFVGGDGSNYLEAGYDNSSPTHAGNFASFVGSWGAIGGWDLSFYIRGGFAPVLVQTENRIAQPSQADLALTGFIPVANTTTGITKTPAAAALALEGFEPVLVLTDDHLVEPAQADLALEGFAPTATVTEDQVVSPGAAALTLAGFSSILVQTDDKVVAPAQGDLLLGGFAPTVVRTDDHLVAPGASALALEGFAPVADSGGDRTVAPGAASLVLEGFAPTIDLPGLAGTAKHNQGTLVGLKHMMGI